MKTPNILLFNPWIEDFAAFDYWLKPLGLISIASWLKNNNVDFFFFDCLDVEHPVHKKYIDKSFKRTPYGSGKFPKYKKNPPDKLKHIKRKWGHYGLPRQYIEKFLFNLPQIDLILIQSTMTYWYYGLKNSIKLLKKIFPNATIIVGGIYTTLCYEHAKKNLNADYIVKSDGFPFLQKFFEEKYNIALTPPDPLMLPFPCDLYPSKNLAVIRLSLGCPFKCTYCASRILHPQFQKAKLDFIKKEIERFIKIGIKNVTFYDDALLVMAKEILIPLLKWLGNIKHNINFHLSNGINLKLFSMELAELFKQNNFITLRFGFETADTKKQVELGNKAHNKDFLKAVKYLHKVGYKPYEIGMFLLTGYPYQKWQEVYESIKYVYDNGARPYLAEYSPIPYTYLWQKSVEISKYDIINEPLYHNNSIFPCEWIGFTYDDLLFLKNEVRKRLFDIKKVYHE